MADNDAVAMCLYGITNYMDDKCTGNSFYYILYLFFQKLPSFDSLSTSQLKNTIHIFHEGKLIET